LLQPNLFPLPPLRWWLSCFFFFLFDLGFTHASVPPLRCSTLCFFVYFLKSVARLFSFVNLACPSRFLSSLTFFPPPFSAPFFYRGWTLLGGTPILPRTFRPGYRDSRLKGVTWFQTPPSRFLSFFTCFCAPYHWPGPEWVFFRSPVKSLPCPRSPPFSFLTATSQFLLINLFSQEDSTMLNSFTFPSFFSF